MADTEEGKSDLVASTDKAGEQELRCQWREFLTSVPPGSLAEIPDLLEGVPCHSRTVMATPIATPDLLLHCSSESCQGERFFHVIGDAPCAYFDNRTCIFLRYSCRNCSQMRRIYALEILVSREPLVATSGFALKIGEWPPFGPPTPARVISMIGPDRDLFLKGRRAESQGLGVGAFAYYRRVVEDQKNRLLEEILRVSRKTGAKREPIQALEEAIKEQQFSKSIQLTKDAIPESLLINGQNPLLLLHRALSVGLHEGADEDCLVRARSIRVVLTELVERISQVLKETAELKEAVNLLQTLKDSPSKKP